MVRIAGINLPKDKRIAIALTYIFGIGKSLALQILKEAGIDQNKRVGAITEAEESILRQIIEKKHKVEGDLRRVISQNIKIFKDINCYRGIRHKKRLPVRGQQTRTNCRTVRGNMRRTMGSGRAKSAQKT